MLVNIISAFLLGYKDHSHDHKHHHDHSLKAAYFHVLADTLTSILAILALFAGKIFGWNWFDSVIGIVGAVVISFWAYGLLKDTSAILLDRNMGGKYKSEIKAIIEANSDNRISDLHLWKVGEKDYAVIIALVTHFPKPTEYYKDLLKGVDGLSHITVEINQCFNESCT